MKKLILIASGIILFASCNNNANQSKGSDNNAVAAISSAEVIPAFDVKDINGNILNLTTFKGKKVFVNMWATWCPPCRAEMPSIQKLYERTKDKNVMFAMIALDDDFNKSISYMKSNVPLLPVFYPAGKLPPMFEVEGIPATFIFDEAGKLIKKIEGSDNYNTAEYYKLLSE